MNIYRLFGTVQTNPEEELYCVYCHQNKINGKRYIGQTVHQDNPNLRWHSGSNYFSLHFRNAINKYGWDAFDHFIIQDNLTKEEADELEKLNIAFYNTTCNKFGYNINEGGSNGKHSELTKQKISKSRKGNSREGTHLSEETKQKISKALTGRVVSDETKAKLKGKKYINNGTIVKKVTADKLQQYLNNGWKLGRV